MAKSSRHPFAAGGSPGGRKGRKRKGHAVEPATKRSRGGDASGGELTCGVCGRTANLKDIEWAATEKSEDASGVEVWVPVGEACHECYYLGVEIMHFASFGDWASKYHSDPEVKDKAETARKTLRSKAHSVPSGSSGPGRQAQFGDKAVARGGRASVEVYYKFDAFTEAELRAATNQTRLSRPLMKSQLKLEMASALDPSVSETLYLFAPDPAKRHFRRVKLSNSEFAELYGKVVDASRLLYATHAEDEYSKSASAAMSELGATAAFTKVATTVSDFVARATEKGKSQEGDDFSPAGGAAPVLSGIAAASLAASRHVSRPFQSPAKQLGATQQIEPIPGSESETVAATPGATSANFDDSRSQVSGSGARHAACGGLRSAASSTVLEDDCGSSELQRKYSLQAFLNGEKDGRSLRPLRLKAQGLLSKDITKIDGQIQMAYIKKLQSCSDLRLHSYVSGLSWDELRLQVLEIDPDVSWPASVLSLVWERRQATLAESHNWKDFFECVRCWFAGAEPPQVRVEEPTLAMCYDRGADFEQELKAHFKKVVRVVFSNHLCPWLFDGASKLDVVKAFVAAGMAEFGKDDPFELPSSAASFVHDVLSVLEALQTLIDFPLDGGGYESVAALAKFDGKQHDCVQVRVLSVMKECEFWKLRRDSFTKAAPTLLEKKDTVAAMQADLWSRGGRPETLQWVAKLQEYCDVVSELEAAVPAEATSGLSTKLLESVQAAVSDALGDAGLLSHSANIAAVQNMVAAAAICFPMARDVVEAQSSIADRLASIDSTKRVEAFADSLDKILNISDSAPTELKATAVNGAASRWSAVNLHEVRGKVEVDVVKRVLSKLLEWTDLENLEPSFAYADVGIKLCEVAEGSGNEQLSSMFSVIRNALMVRSHVNALKVSSPKTDDVFEQNQAMMRRLLAQLVESQGIVDANAKKGAIYDPAAKKSTALLEAVIGDASQLSTSLHQEAIVEAGATVEKATATLATVLGAAFTTTHGAQAWKHGLQQGDSFDEVAGAYQRSLAGLDLSGTWVAAETARRAIDDLRRARSNSGATEVDTQQCRDAEALTRSCVTVAVEQKLMSAMLSGDSSTAKRLQIQSSVKLLRSWGVKEKDVLHPAVFQRSYNIILGK